MSRSIPPALARDLDALFYGPRPLDPTEIDRLADGLEQHNRDEDMLDRLPPGPSS